jgi:hypothetical protein
MKTIATLYGGCAMNTQDLMFGDCLSVRLLDNAVAMLIGNDFLKGLKKKNNQIKIKMSKLTYSQLHTYDLSLLFTNYFNYDNITLYNDNISYDEEGVLVWDNKDLNHCPVMKTTVSLKNKQVEIFTSCL